MRQETYYGTPAKIHVEQSHFLTRLSRRINKVRWLGVFTKQRGKRVKKNRFRGRHFIHWSLYHDIKGVGVPWEYAVPSPLHHARVYHRVVTPSQTSSFTESHSSKPCLHGKLYKDLKQKQRSNHRNRTEFVLVVSEHRRHRAMWQSFSLRVQCMWQHLWWLIPRRSWEHLVLVNC